MANLTVVARLAFLGFSWAICWQTDVGPGTFFTAPQLMLDGDPLAW